MAFRRLFRPAFATQLRRFSDKKTPSTPTAPQIPVEKPEPTIAALFSREGDTGTSKTLSGQILPKDNPVFNAIGATEELLSYLGMAREFALESEQEYSDRLKRVQTIIIDLSTGISRQNGQECISHEHTEEIEDWINEYAQQLSPPEDYVIPGGGVASASLQVARSICRRTERVVIPLVKAGTLHHEAQVYLNRLSDFLFTISRLAAKKDQRTESIYIPKPDTPCDSSIGPFTTTQTNEWSKMEATKKVTRCKPLLDECLKQGDY